MVVGELPHGRREAVVRLGRWSGYFARRAGVGSDCATVW